LNKANYKFKIISKDYLLLCLDRLTRFKHPAINYKRVYFDIITKYLIEPKFNKKELENTDAKEIVTIVETIWNNSVREICKTSQNFEINQILINELNNLYIINDNYVKTLLNAKLDIFTLLQFVDENSPFNLIRLKKISKLSTKTEENITDLRHKKGLKFPVEKIVLVEGITEELLLPKFAQELNYDFDKNGVYLISAGGKNQVARLYVEFLNQVKVPMMILLDYDAVEIQNLITPKLRKQDKMYLLKKGEFEDILPLQLIKKTLNKEFKNQFEIKIDELKSEEKMVKVLTEVLRNHGINEFKKADFAKSVLQNIDNKTVIDDEIIRFINELKK